MKEKTVRTTFSLPAEILAATDLLVQQGKIMQQGKIKSRNQFIAEAISNELAAREKTEIDAAFSEMAADQEYQVEALQIEAEFATAS